ncbi:MAG: TlpA family protein disulfide reductase [Ramlibacter sp.]|nr:TlpA family protein disulfide reductase [Ramlibacter sp.]
MRVGHTRRNWLRFTSACAAASVLPATANAAEVLRWPAPQPLPALDAVDLSGRNWSLPALHGRGVVLNFWASWCEPCRAEMPTLQQLADFYGEEQVTVLALNFKESPATAARFARQTGMKLPVLLDPGGEIARRWQVKVFPTTVLVGADGRPRWRVRGEMDWTGKEAGRLVEALLS